MPALRKKGRAVRRQIVVQPSSLWVPTNARSIRIEAHPFDQGYWARYFGLPKPTSEEGLKGWGACETNME